MKALGQQQISKKKALLSQNCNTELLLELPARRFLHQPPLNSQPAGPLQDLELASSFSNPADPLRTLLSLYSFEFSEHPIWLGWLLLSLANIFISPTCNKNIISIKKVNLGSHLIILTPKFQNLQKYFLHMSFRIF